MQIIEIGEADTSYQSELVVGIDFGTTNSLIATIRDGKVLFATTDSGSDLLASVVSYALDGGEVKVAVGNRKVTSNSIFSVKRLFGKSYTEIRNAPSLQALCHGLLNQENDTPIVQFKNFKFSITKVAAEIFISLKKSAESEWQEEIKKAVISIPAYFNDWQRGQVMLAAKLANIEVIRLIAEPTAAAYAYGLNKKSDGTYLVYDLGGGTFDVSILHMQEGVLQVVACGGDNNLGGDDIDFAIAEFCAKKVSIKTIDTSIISFAKSIKEDLSFHAEIAKELDGQIITITRSDLEKIIENLINKTVKIAHDVHRAAEMIDLNGIILVGGSTRIPLIKDKLKQAFNVNLYSDIDPDRAVALGAALQADNLTTKRNMLLIDVLPLSIGLELYGDIVEKVILRNTPLPFSVKKQFTTYADNQAGMQFHILQGEREMVKDCRSIARFELKDLPAMPAGRVKVEVIFSIDADGILSITAKDVLTGKAADIEVKPSFGLSEQQVVEELESAYLNAAKDHNTKLLVQTKLEAKALLKGINKAMLETPDILLEKETNEINEGVNSLQNALNEDNRDKILAKMQELNRLAASFIEKHLNLGADKMLLGRNIKEMEG